MGEWEIFTRNKGENEEWAGGYNGGWEILKVFLQSWQRDAYPLFYE